MMKLYLTNFRRKAATVYRAVPLAALGFALLLTGCKDEMYEESIPQGDPPTVEALTVISSSIVHDGATFSFKISKDGGIAPNQAGICWATEGELNTAEDELPNIENKNLGRNAVASPGVGDFNGSVKGLVHNTKYYVRAFASNPQGTAYSEVITFTTAELQAPSLETTTYEDLKYSSATIKGNVTDEGDRPLQEMGIVWSRSENPVLGGANVSSKKVEPAAAGAFSTALTGLEKNTTYYVRTYARSAAGTNYSEQVAVKTPDVNMPEMGTLSISGGVPGTSSVKLEVEVTSLGETDNTAGGIEISTTMDFAAILQTKEMTTPIAVGVFQTEFTGLNDATSYFGRAFIETDAGRAVSAVFPFSTKLNESLAYYAPKGMLIGGTAMTRLGENAKVEQLIQENYNVLQIGVNPVGATSLCGWPSKEVHETAEFVKWVDWCAAKGIEPVGNFLTGGLATYYPDWLTGGTWSAAELETLLENRIKAVIQAANGKVKKWIVISEPFNSANRNYSVNPFTAIGTASNPAAGANPAQIPLYIEKAIAFARKYAGNDAEVIISERGFERSMLTEVRSTSLVQLLTYLGTKGVTVDGVAIQGHTQFAAGGWNTETVAPPATGSPAPIRWDVTIQQARRFQDLGLKVYFNEVEICRNNATSGPVPAGEQDEYMAKQQMHYRNFLTAIVEGKSGTNLASGLAKQIDGIMFYGYADGMIPAGHRADDQASLFDASSEKKPAYYTVLEYLKGTGLYK